MQLEHGINLLHRTFLFVQEWHASLTRVAMLVVCVGMRTASDGGAEVAQIPEPAEKNQPTFNFGERLFRWIQSSGESIEEVLILRYVCGIGWRSN